MSAPRRMVVLLGLLLAVVVGWNVRAVIGFDFVAMDDDINIYFNPHLGSPGAATLKWMFTDMAYIRRYVPLGWLAFSSVHSVSGLSPVGYHTANLALHVANAWLLFVVLLRMSRRWTPEPDEKWIAVCAAIGAGLWALHPFRAETVGWASGLFYGPAGAFALLSVFGYLKMLEAGSLAGRRWPWLLFTAGAYLVSMLVYPVGLGLIGIFVIMDVAERPRELSAQNGQATVTSHRRRQIAEKLILLVPTGLVLSATIVGPLHARGFWAKSASIEEFGWWPRAAQAAYAWARFLWQRWWPLNLTPAPTRLIEFNPTEPVFWLLAIGLIGVTAGLWVRPASRRGAWLFWLGFFVLLAPMLGVLEHPYFACDRYDYLPGMVVSAAVGIALTRLPARWRVAIASATLVVVAGLAWCQREQLKIWTNVDTLERRMISASDNLAFRVTRYGVWARYHAARGEKKLANEILAECERTCGPGPWVAELRTEIAATVSAAALHTRMANDFSRAGQSSEAREHFQAALALNPQLTTAAINFAMSRAIEGEPRDALHWYLRAVANSPDEVSAVTRRQVLGLIAEAFSGAHQPKLAARAAELALRENGSLLEREPLRHQLELYLRAAHAPESG